MIHPWTPVSLGEASASYAPYLSAPWATLITTWWFNGPPLSLTINPNQEERLIRWNLPASFQDNEGGRIGVRSQMWHPARTLADSGMGIDGKDFARKGLKEDGSETEGEDWGL